MAIHADDPRVSYGDDAPATAMPGGEARTVLISGISWGAVLAGVVLALVVQTLLNMLGIGIGAATIEPGAGDSPSAATFSISAAIWWIVSGIIAAFVGGLAAGRLSGRPRQTTAAWHGLLSWAVTTLVVLYLLTTAVSSVVGGTLSTLGSALGGVGQGVTQATDVALEETANPFAKIERQVRQAVGDPQAIQEAAVASVRAVVTGDEAQKEAARTEAAQALANAQNISVEQAREQVAEFEAQYTAAVTEAQQQVGEAAETAAGATATSAIVAVVALLLGAVAAWFGGHLGWVVPTSIAWPRSRPGA